MASVVDEGNLSVAMTCMANGMGSADGVLSREFAAAAGRRTSRFDQLGADAASMWAVALTSPTVMAAHGMRVAGESGAGRTRAETNRPSETSAADKVA